MSTDPHAAALALHRFGFGPRPGGIAAIASDPRGAVLAELNAGVAPIADANVLPGGESARRAFADQQQRVAARAVKKETMADAPADPMEAMEKKPAAIPVARQIYLTEAKARYDAVMRADIGLTERLVWFWSNHFCVSAEKPLVLPQCGPYEREAIRPHVLGTFADLLIATESHPAMLFYLDNIRSLGPDSEAGKRLGRGLNENLAREILELHTLGVRTGYTQSDVTSFAKVITGWSIVPFRQDPVRGGEFTFNARMHEPGPQTVLGKVYAQEDAAQGHAVLRMLARHPATARHIATKLARHFVADDPPQPLVDRLAKRFLDTDGDLKELTRTLITAPEAWDAPRGKLKRPSEWLMAILRANEIQIVDVRRTVNAENLLGEPLWRPPAPKGYSDDSAAWLDGMGERLDVANQIGRTIGDRGQEPDALVDVALGPLASRDTRETIQRAESRQQALALLMMAPEFQRR